MTTQSIFQGLTSVGLLGLTLCQACTPMSAMEDAAVDVPVESDARVENDTPLPTDAGCTDCPPPIRTVFALTAQGAGTSHVIDLEMTAGGDAAILAEGTGSVVWGASMLELPFLSSVPPLRPYADRWIGYVSPAGTAEWAQHLPFAGFDPSLTMGDDGSTYVESNRFGEPSILRLSPSGSRTWEVTTGYLFRTLLVLGSSPRVPADSVLAMRAGPGNPRRRALVEVLPDGTVGADVEPRWPVLPDSDAVGEVRALSDGSVLGLGPTQVFLDGPAAGFDDLSTLTMGTGVVVEEVAADPAGDLYLVGCIRGPSVLFGAATESNGREDGFLAALDRSSGALRWVQVVGGRHEDCLLGVTVDRGVVIAVGRFEDEVTMGERVHRSRGGSDMLMTAWSTSGEALWSLSAGGPGEDAWVQATSQRGRVLVAGDLSGGADLLPGERVAVSSEVGVLLWSFERTDALGDLCADVACPGGACGTGRCDPATGACTLDPLPNGTACSDGDACTTESTCTSGVCVGVPMDCSALDDTCTVGRCLPFGGGCEGVPAPDGTSCALPSLGACRVATCSRGACVAVNATDCSACEGGGYCAEGACAAAPPTIGTVDLTAGMPAGWAGTGAHPWVYDEAEGSLRSAAIDHSESSGLRMTVRPSVPSVYSFAFELSSDGVDRLQLSVDGVETQRWTVSTTRGIATVSLSPGEHVLDWEYIKDAVEAAGQDAARIRGVTVVAASQPGTDGFESGLPSSYDILDLYGGGQWSLLSSDAQAGAFSVGVSVSSLADVYTTMRRSVTLSGPGSVSFWFRLEGNCIDDPEVGRSGTACMRLNIDGRTVEEYGAVDPTPWRSSTHLLEAGVHDVEWVFNGRQDFSTDHAGVWVDEVRIAEDAARAPICL